MCSREHTLADDLLSIRRRLLPWTAEGLAKRPVLIDYSPT
jgi:hypothetical protein